MDSLAWVDDIRVTSVMDNYVDVLIGDDGPAKRRNSAGNQYERTICAEHGFAEAVQSRIKETACTVLFDFGVTPSSYLRNLSLLAEDFGFTLEDVDGLVLSHGHGDHYGGLRGLLDANQLGLSRRLRLYVGGDAFLPRWKVLKDGSRRSMGCLDRSAIERDDLEIVTVEHPTVIEGQALISGGIGRHTPYESGPTPLRVGPEGRDIADDMPGEQALIYKLVGKGLVVLTACCHAGIVNTVRHAQETTGVADVHAILGGFHLTGAPDERIEKTVEDLASLNPDFVAPMHCTGLVAIDALKARLGNRILCNSVGTQYQFN